MQRSIEVWRELGMEETMISALAGDAGAVKSCYRSVMNTQV